MASNVLVLNPFEQTFGLPPASYVSDTMIVNSMPVMEITPCTPHFASGLTLFRVEEAWTQYSDILENLGFRLSSQPIRLAFIADNFPTDSFSNEYGETFLQKFTDVASQGMQQLAQMAGANSGIEGIRNIGNAFQNIGNETGGTVGNIIGAGGGGAVEIANALNKLKSSAGNQSGFLQGSLNTIDKLVAGNRVDFPMIWRNSGYTPSYTATIRLYNPNPGSASATARHIIGPLAIILCLSIPRSDDGKTFNWPFFHKIKCKGVYNLSPAVISNVTVIKGGDQQQISYNQKLAMVDVRIDFTSLYGTMLLEKSDSMEFDRPTVRNYLASLVENDSTLSYTRNEMRQAAANAAGSSLQGDRVFISSQTSVSEENLLAKNAAAARKRAPTVANVDSANRVPDLVSATQTSLEGQSPTGFGSA